MNNPKIASGIDGVWKMVRAELDGEAAPELVVRNTTMEFAHGGYHVRFQGETAETGTFELGQRLKVRIMLLRATEGPTSGRTIPCIFQRTGDRLRVCYGIDGVAPTEFKTSGTQSRYLVTYRRKAGKA